MNTLLDFLIALASIPRVVAKWGRAGTPQKFRMRKSDLWWLTHMRPTISVRKRMRLANQGRVYGWSGRARYV